MRSRISSRPQKNARSEEHTSELQSHSGISYAVFCLKKKKSHKQKPTAFATSGHAGSTAITTFAFFFFNDTATTEIYTPLYTLSLHDALPISEHVVRGRRHGGCAVRVR